MSKKAWIGVVIVLVVVIALFMFFRNQTPTGQVIADQEAGNVAIKETKGELSFYDLNTNCSLDGRVYINGNLVGESVNGAVSIENKNYGSNSTVSIRGSTGYCFGKDAGLPLFYSWIVSDIDSYTENKEVISLEGNLSLRQPLYLEQMQGFIRPYEVMPELSEISISPQDGQKENIDKIYKKHHLNYITDQSLFGKADYWQTPAETRRNRGGDCEDWAIKFVSLLRAYDPTLNCYMAIWDTHANVLCRLGTTFLIYDQDEITAGVKLEDNKEGKDIMIQDNKIAFRNIADYL